MRHRFLIATFALCISFILGNSLGVEVCANEKETTSDIIIEYNDYSNISESIQSETGTTMHLSSIENMGDVYQAVYCEADILQQASDSQYLRT